MRKFPFASARRVANSLKAGIRDFRIYGRALTSQEAAAVSVSQTLTEIAALPKTARTSPQLQKMELAFLATGASPRSQNRIRPATRRAYRTRSLL